MAGVPEEADEILTGVYLGSEWSAKNSSHLQSNNVGYVLTVASGIHPPFPDKFKYKVVPVFDMESVDLLSHFVDCHEFIKEAHANGKSVLVHCHAGASRSATIVISYVMKELGLGMEQALGYVVAKRPVVCPNYGFLLQLQKFEDHLQKGHPIPVKPPSYFEASARQISYWYTTSAHQ